MNMVCRCLYFVGVSAIIFMMVCSNPVNKDDGILSTFKISGALNKSRATGGIATADSVCAIMSIQGNYSEFFKWMSSASINANGTFSILLPTPSEVVKKYGDVPIDWVLVLINSKAVTRFDKVVGYVAIKDLSESLIKMPVSKVKADSLILGTLETNGDEAQSESVALDTVAFTLTVAQLKEMAQMDRTLKMIKNAYANYHPASEGGTLDLRPKYTFPEIQYSKAKNTYLTPSGYVDTSILVYGIQFFTENQNLYNYQQMVSGAISFDLYPPVAVKVGDGGNYASVPSFVSTSSSKNNAANIKPNVYIGQPEGSGNSIQSFSFASFKGVMPDGVWNLKKNESELCAQFDLGLGDPFDSVTGAIRVYVPSIMATVSDANILQNVSVQWNYWDPSAAAYVRATDLGCLQNSVSYVEVAVRGKGPNNEETVERTELGQFPWDNPTNQKVTDLVFAPTQQWTYAWPVRIFVTYFVDGQCFEITIGRNE
ncbi:MAG: hypothetical protein JW795_17475 [Chitinivibrionales bacterium]|nr:hypothetical protein [Chitinivibrionales bacterium]